MPYLSRRIRTITPKKELPQEPPWRQKLWVFCNSAFGIWLFSTIVVGAFTATYQWVQENDRQIKAANDLHRNLELEVTSRFDQLVQSIYTTRSIGNGFVIYPIMNSSALNYNYSMWLQPPDE